MEIQILRRQGKGIREFIKLTGLSRNTVRKYLRHGHEPRAAPRPRRPSKLDPFKDYIMKRVEVAKPDRLPANVIVREIADMGYQRWSPKFGQARKVKPTNTEGLH